MTRRPDPTISLLEGIDAEGQSLKHPGQHLKLPGGHGVDDRHPPRLLTGTAGTRFAEHRPLGVIAGAALRAARRTAGCTQEELAEALMTSVDTVKRWENGQRPIGHVKAAELARLQRSLRQLGARSSLLTQLQMAIDADEFISRAAAGDCSLLGDEVTTRPWSSLVAWALTGVPPAEARDVAARRLLLRANDRQAVFAALREAVNRVAGSDDGPNLLLCHQAYYLAAMDSSSEGSAWLAQTIRADIARTRLTGSWNPAWAGARSMAVAAACQGDPGPLRWFIRRHMGPDDCIEANLTYWALWAGSDPEPASCEDFMAERRMDMRKGAGLVRHLTAHLSEALPYADLSVSSLLALVERWPALLRYDPDVTAELGTRVTAMLDSPIAASSRASLSQLHVAVRSAA